MSVHLIGQVTGRYISLKIFLCHIVCWLLNGEIDFDNETLVFLNLILILEFNNLKIASTSGFPSATPC